jgi:hypothetical protein
MFVEGEKCDNRWVPNLDCVGDDAMFPNQTFAAVFQTAVPFAAGHCHAGELQHC